MPRRDAKCPSPRICSCLYSTSDFSFGSPIPSSVTAASRYAITSLIVDRAAYSTLSASKSNSPSLLSLDTVSTNVPRECPRGVSAAVWACPHRTATSTGQRRSQRLGLVSQHRSDLLLLDPWKPVDEFANSGSRSKVLVDRQERNPRAGSDPGPNHLGGSCSTPAHSFQFVMVRPPSPCRLRSGVG